MNDNKLKEQCIKATQQICEKANLHAGDLFVVGCSSSEVCGDIIGTGSSLETAKIIFNGIYSVLQEKGIYLAAQCCEHLNRALVVERAVCERFSLEEVNVIPQPKAGGSFAVSAYEGFSDAVMVENLKQSAKAGLDIGGTLIGMHIKPVVVPLRIELDKIGQANIICARYRPKFVGGERAKYNENLL